MQPIAAYTDATGPIRLILQGDPKSGKTTLACQFPGAYIIDVDVNLRGPLKFLKERNLTLPIGFDVLDKDENGADVPMTARYQRFSRLMEEAEKNPDVKTIVIDSATGFTDILMAETKRLQPGIKDGRQLWGFFFEYGKALMVLLKRVRKHIILICHEKLEKNPDGSVVFPYRVAWPGQLGNLLPSFFTDVWRCEAKEIPKGLQKEYKFLVKTMPDYQFKLGNSMGLPPEFEFEWSKVEEKLK